MIVAIFPYFLLERKYEARSITKSHPDRLLSHLDGCKLEQKLLDTEECPDGKPHRPDGDYLV
jgi:hypothetical protein